ncbi:MAG TPA: serine/threonine-protein kinase [Rudaea sp.]|nr:serine/threonine-protein kinase [Rudaea sp.]
MDRFASIRALFEAAAEKSPDQRTEFLRDACGADDALRREVESLLDNDTNVDDPLAASVRAVAEDHFDATTPWLGKRIGSYRIVTELGHGGMGSVFLAERADDEFRSRVAVKLIRGFPTPQALQRLRRERQMLAGLVHPNIARLLDGGTTAEGQPYLVMEYVDGLPLTRWLGECKPSLVRRLRAFRQLCSAVHHAHRNLIVHRDLKPANIMVRADDKPMLLDFGIAKLTAPDTQGERETVLRAFTTDYASPEQIGGGLVTTASDIYALGLILYEMLCGRPYRVDGNVDSWRHSRPGHVAASAPAAWLRADSGHISGDLEGAVQHALAEDPERRYASAAAFAADIGRFLDGKPLEAGPDSIRYRLGKFVRRHRLACAIAMVSVAAILGTSLWLAAERARALHAEHRAQLEARTANQVTDFLLGLFHAVDPKNTRGQDISARQLLDHGSAMLNGELQDQPQVRARLLLALGEIYLSIGVPERSANLLDQAVHLMGAPGSDPLRLAFALNESCRALTKMSDYTRALATCREALAIRQARLASSDPDLGHTYDALGVAEQEHGDFAAAAADYHKALAIFSAAGPKFRDALASTHHNLGFLARQRGDYPIARSEYSIALAIKRALYGDAHPLTLNSLSGLAQAEQALGDLKAAQRDLDTVLELRVKVHGTNSIDVAHAHNDLASVLQDLGDYAGAARHYHAAMDLETGLLPADSMGIAVTANNLASLDEDRGDCAAALPLLRQSLRIRAIKFKPPHPSLARAQNNLARCELALRDMPAARRNLDAALTARRKLGDPLELFDSQLLDVEWQLAAGHVRAASVALQALTAPSGRGNYRRRALYAQEQARIAAARKDFPAARAAQAQALDELGRELGTTHPLYARACVWASAYAHAAHDNAAARARLSQALPVLDANLVAGAPDRIKAHHLAASLGSQVPAKRRWVP